MFSAKTFATVALAAYSKATGDKQAQQEALDLFKLIIRYRPLPVCFRPNSTLKPAPAKRWLMILIVTLRSCATVDDPTLCNEWINRSIAEIERVHET